LAPFQQSIFHRKICWKVGNNNLPMPRTSCISLGNQALKDLSLVFWGRSNLNKKNFYNNIIILKTPRKCGSKTQTYFHSLPLDIPHSQFQSPSLQLRCQVCSTTSVHLTDVNKKFCHPKFTHAILISDTSPAHSHYALSWEHYATCRTLCNMQNTMQHAEHYATYRTHGVSCLLIPWISHLLNVAQVKIFFWTYCFQAHNNYDLSS
jgi:hypothetical protein